MKIQDFQDNVTCGGFDNIFANIYKPQDIESQKSRYMSAVEKFTALYPNRNDIHVYSAPGRTEIGGNHTDHQHRLHTPQDISERYRSAARAILPLMRILPLSIHTLEQTVSSHS